MKTGKWQVASRFRSSLPLANSPLATHNSQLNRYIIVAMPYVIETEQLTKLFEQPQGWRRIARLKPTTAVNGVTFQVNEGELFGLLGPNGAGKTTLVKMLSTLILPTTGRATVAGYPLSQIQAIRAAVGLVVADERSFYWRLTGRENLKFFAALYQLYGRPADDRVAEVLAEIDLSDRADERFSNYSTGMRQRLAIGRSLLHRPGLLFLDEPSRSLDPLATQRLHGLIQRLMAQQGVTVFLITHDLAEAEKLCNRVAVMNKGQIRAVGSPAGLRRQLAGQFHYTVRCDPLPEPVQPKLQAIVPTYQAELTFEQMLVRFPAGENDGKLTTILDTLRQHNLTIYSIEGTPPSLEQVFAHYTREE